MAPDLLVLQEVWATGEENQAERIGAATGLPHLAWSPRPQGRTRYETSGGQPVDVRVGNAVLSRWPLQDEVVEVLPGAADARTALGVVVAHPDGRVPVVTVHLSSTLGGSALRVRQVRTVADLVARVAARAADRVPLLAGDFNAEPESDEMRLLGGHLTAPAVPGQVLVDVWRLAGAESPDAPGWTWRRDNPFVGTGSPDARIDHVLVGAGGRVHRVGLVGAGPYEGVWPSDHAGVWADLDV